MSINETLVDVVRESVPDGRALAQAALDKYKIVRSEVDLKVRTTYLSREMIADVSLTHTAPSLARVILDDRPCWEHVISTHGVMRNNRTVCDPDDLVGPECDIVFKNIHSVCNVEPVAGFDKRARNSVVAATNSPAIVACNKVHLDHVLLCGVDSSGADFTRLMMGMQEQNIRSIVVDVVDWRAKVNRKDWPSYPGIHVRAVVSDMSELVKALSTIDEEPLYSFILLNHTFTSFAHFDIDHLIDMLSRARAAGINCQLVGTYWDPHTMMITAFQGIDPITRNFSYEGEVVMEGVRYNKFMMLGTHYCDPVMDAYDVRVRFMKEGFWVNHWHASRYIEDYAGVRPDIYKKVKLLAGLRVFTVKNTFEIPTVRQRSVVSSNVMASGSKAILVDIAQAASFPVKKNKGRHWIGRDSLYVGPDVMCAKKLNGLHCQLTIAGNTATIISPFGGMVIGLPGRVDGSHYFEAELMFREGWEDRCSNPVGNITQSQAMHNELLSVRDIVIFDGILGGTAYCRAFIDRWEDILNFFKVNESFMRVFQLQEYLVHPTADDLRELWNSSGEGVVIQPACSPAGCFGDGAGSARYLKKRITIEVDRPDGIVEVDMDGAVVRKRPDRVVATNVAELTMIREFWSFEEFFIFYRAMRNLYDPVGSRYPILRTIKEYAMAVEGSIHMYDASEIIQDIYFAYMSYYSGSKCDVGPISNVAELVKTVDMVRRKKLIPDDYLRVLKDSSRSDRLIAEIQAKDTLSVEDCPVCSRQLSGNGNFIVISSLESLEYERSIGRFPNGAYFGIPGMSLCEMLTANEKLSDLTHWFLYEGSTHRDGVTLKYNRSMGDIKKRLISDGMPAEVTSFFESLEVFNVSVPYGAVIVGNKKTHLWAEFLTVNIVLEPRRAGVWYRPMINKRSMLTSSMRCLGDMIRYVSYVHDLAIISGI